MMQAKEELDNATIVSANDNALDIFSFRDQPEKFGELRSGLSDQGTIDSRWIKELFHVVRRVAGGRKFSPYRRYCRNMTVKCIDRYFAPSTEI